jgi:RsiW-degrading membrane proteinase PrsW (M82 family)
MILSIILILFTFHFCRNAYQFGEGKPKISVGKFWLRFLVLIIFVCGWQGIWAYAMTSSNYAESEYTGRVVVVSILSGIFLALIIALPVGTISWLVGKRAKSKQSITNSVNS